MSLNLNSGVALLNWILHSCNTLLWSKFGAYIIRSYSRSISFFQICLMRWMGMLKTKRMENPFRQVVFVCNITRLSSSQYMKKKFVDGFLDMAWCLWFGSSRHRSTVYVTALYCKRFCIRWHFPIWYAQIDVVVVMMISIT